MKKLLALAAAALFCIGAGIEFILPKEDTFGLNTETASFYWSPNREALDAATLYKLQNGIDRSKDPCDTNNVTPSRYAGAMWADSAPYWPFIKEDGTAEISVEDYTSENDGRQQGSEVQLNKAQSSTSGTVSLNWWVRAKGLASTQSTDGTSETKEKYYICAPLQGTIETSHYACDGGHTMVFKYTYDNKEYTMTIQNAVCWYCCKGKTPSDPKSGCEEIDGVTMYKANTPTSLKGRVMEAGQLLCVADANTQIIFTVS